LRNWTRPGFADRPGFAVRPRFRRPPHITIEQAKNLTAALLKGDADAPGIIRQVAKMVADKVTG
jgi:hypothetical protein